MLGGHSLLNLIFVQISPAVSMAQKYIEMAWDQNLGRDLSLSFNLSLSLDLSLSLALARLEPD